MTILVQSEIGGLKKVLLHRPGRELEQLTPACLEQLLFDDIPYLAAARQEHDRFAQVLRENGAEVLYIEDLLAEVLICDAALKEQFITDFIREAGPVATHYHKEIRTILFDQPDAKSLVLKTMSGVTVDDLHQGSRGPLVRLLTEKPQFAMDPMPNLYFTRDPFASVGRGISMNQMYSVTRRRETIYGRYILNYHTDYRGHVDFYYRHDAPFSIEGGDILNLSARVLAVGLSMRTVAEAVELLAANIFARPQTDIDTILVLDIPNLRAYMHLDTVFTQVDREVFTIHPGILDTLKVYRLQKKGTDGSFQAQQCEGDLAVILKQTLGLAQCHLIHCGGRDTVSSAREQWNDGANTLAVAPGRVVVYDRNTVTNQALREAGIDVLEVPSSELSRGRGGPRCMSMPLLRLPVD